MKDGNLNTIKKTPITYYGGKLNLVEVIKPMIPPHVQYGEPFCGGASLFWSKPKSKNEFLNDYDLKVANFWECIKTDFDELQRLIHNTLHSEFEHKKARQILKQPLTDRVQYAWAFWVQTQMSFSGKIFAGFAFSNDKVQGRTTRNKRENFTIEIYERLKDVEIFNRDALELIQIKNDPNTFIYLDPPYPEGDCGHYKKGKKVYYDLLEMLPELKCKWLMSSYPSDRLTELRKKWGFNSNDLTQNLGVTGKHNAGKKKTECLTWNYTYIGQTTNLLF